MQNMIIKKEIFKKALRQEIKDLFRTTLEDASTQQVYQALCYVVKDQIIDNWMKTQKAMHTQDPKIVYYMSMEFLTGRYLGNNLLALTAYEEVKKALQELHIDLNAIEDEERDPALGNGGLGRLAACFLDSLSTLGYAAYGCGIRYHYGMFRQRIKNGQQVEEPDRWLKNGGYPFELKRPEYAKEIRFGGDIEVDYDEETGRNHFRQVNYRAVMAVPYDLPIVGYGNGVVNTLRIWDAEAIEDFQLESFDKGDYQKSVEQENLARTITRVLYPNDNYMSGKELRLKQQYFFVSASLQAAIARYKRDHKDIRKLHEKAVFHMNDTHPTLTVPELMRLLLDEEKLEWDEAWEVVSHACAYTNHTIMAEALEKWPIELFKRLLPRVYQIVDEINRRFVEQIQAKYPNDEERVRKMAILYNGEVRMANLAIASGFSVNGVAKLHTEILEARELREFYEMMPEKFSNKTNGVTQRRFLLHGDPLLADWITKHVGKTWVTDLQKIEKLTAAADKKSEQEEILRIKRENKVRLAEYILETTGVEVNPDSIFDVQVKRLHEYKRQLLNILHVMYLYNKVRENPDMPFYPRTFIFGAKASAAYHRAKLIIRLINNVASVINADESIQGKIKVVFIEDYRVSNAEMIFAAADVSEQISTASREASGTSNMKFMMNGALTLGTMDGANVEIVDEVGEENAFIFGLTAEQVIEYERFGSYNPYQYVDQDWELRRVLDQLVDGTYSGGDREMFRDLHNSLLVQQGGSYPDVYFILADFRPYAQAQERVEQKYRDRNAWAKSMILNIAHSGKFSSDRTIQDYVDDIWHLDKIKVRW